MSWSWRSPSTRELYVLRCLSNGQVQRHGLCGDLEPYLVDGHSVDGSLTLLALRGLVAFDVTGVVRMTTRGREALMCPAINTIESLGPLLSSSQRHSDGLESSTQPADRDRVPQ